MITFIRKCIALSKSNKQYIDNLIKKNFYKNFSQAINTMIEERRNNV